MNVSRASVADVPSIVKVHMSAFPDFFLTKLGAHFLHTYYRAFVMSDDGCVLCAKDDTGEVVAFCAAAYLSSGFNKRLVKKRLVPFMIEGIHLLFSRPNSLIRLIKNFSKTSDQEEDSGQYAELFSIATEQELQGKGLGKMLIEELEKELLRVGVHEVSLTTDANDNEPTLAFYKKIGYEIMYPFVSYPNREMLRLIKRLSSGSIIE